MREYRRLNRERVRAADRLRVRNRTEWFRAYYLRMRKEQRERLAEYGRRKKRKLALRDLPEPLHEMRLALLEYRSKLRREGCERIDAAAASVSKRAVDKGFGISDLKPEG